MRRLHRSTYVVIFIPLLILVAANCGGNITPAQRTEFGWPWVYGDGLELADPIRPYSEPLGLWQFYLVERLHLLPLAGNIAVALVFIGTIAALWEYRCRTTRAGWKFSLRDALVGMAVAAILLAWCLSLFHDRRCEQRLRSTLVGTQIEGTYTEYDDVPADWFWNMIYFPTKHRPRPCIHVTLDVGWAVEAPVLPPEALAILGDFGSLDSIKLTNVSLPEVEPAQLSWLKSLEANHATRLRGLENATHLETLYGQGTKWSDDDFSKSAPPGLKSLEFLNTAGADFHGSGLRACPQLERMRLWRVTFDEAGFEALLAMPKLKYLELDDCHLILAENWNEYLDTRDQAVIRHILNSESTATALRRLQAWPGIEFGLLELDVSRHVAEGNQ